MNHSLNILASLCLVAGFTACTKSKASTNTPAEAKAKTETKTEAESTAPISCEDMSDCPEGQLCLPGGDDSEMHCMEEADTAAGYDGDTMGQEEEEEAMQM